MALMSKSGPCHYALCLFIALVALYMAVSVGSRYNRQDRRGHYKANSEPNLKSMSSPTRYITLQEPRNASEGLAQQLGHNDYSTKSTSNVHGKTEQRELMPAHNNTSSPRKQQHGKQIPDPFDNGYRMPFMFIHIPKTGGETMENILHVGKSHEALRTREKGDLCSPTNQKPGRVWCKTTCACDVYLSEGDRKHWRSCVENGQPLPVLKISIVRNPFERALSWYYFCIHGYGSTNRLPWPFTVCQAAIDFSFSEWVVKVFKTREVRGGGRKEVWGMKWNQVQWLQGADGKIDWSTTFLIRNENREETTAQAAKLIGVDLSSKELHVRKNPSTWPHGHDYHDYYDDQSREIIEKAFAKDLRELNYTF